MPKQELCLSFWSFRVLDERYDAMGKGVSRPLIGANQRVLHPIQTLLAYPRTSNPLDASSKVDGPPEGNCSQALLSRNPCRKMALVEIYARIELLMNTLALHPGSLEQSWSYAGAIHRIRDPILH